MAEKIESLKDIKVAAQSETVKPTKTNWVVLMLPAKEKTPLPAYGLNPVKAILRLMTNLWISILLVRF